VPGRAQQRGRVHEAPASGEPAGAVDARHRRDGDAVQRHVRPADQEPRLHLPAPHHGHPAHRQRDLLGQGGAGAVRQPAAAHLAAGLLPPRASGQSVRALQPRLRQGPRQALPAQGHRGRARAQHQPQVHLSG